MMQPSLYILSCIFVTLTTAQTFVPIRVNCGGKAFTDPSSNITWVGDTYSLVGRAKGSCTTNTSVVNATSTIQPLYCTHRLFRASGAIIDPPPYQYNIPVLSTTSAYTVRLHFVEPFYKKIVSRIFNISIEGVSYVNGLDLFAVAGYNTAYIYQVPATIGVADGILSIQFFPVKNNPVISGIEVVLAPSIPTPVSVATPITVPTPVLAPIKAPTKQPSKTPTKQPSKTPTKQPSTAPIKAPSKAPTKQPSKQPVQVPTKAPVPVPVPVTQPSNAVVYRINCGGNAVTDVNGTAWSADQYYSGGTSYSTCGNVTNSIYCTNRYQKATGAAFKYNFPVAENGPYLINLHFAEQYFTSANKRLFDVQAEGILVIDDFDIFKSAPGQNVGKVVSFGTTITDKTITIDFLRVLQNPQVNSIEILYLGPNVAPPTFAPVVPPTPIPVSLPQPIATAPIPQPLPVAPPNSSFQDILINCGGASYLESSGQRIWAADKFFSGGTNYSSSTIPIDGTEDDTIYQSIRIGTFSYAIPVPAGTYEVIIHLAELVYTTIGTRKFDLTVEGESFPSVDIVSIAGSGQRAVTLTYFPVVNDGFVTISVADIENNSPCLNGIEIISSVPHLAHAVSNGPYQAVDTTNVGSATVTVDGSESHTHGSGLDLISWIWKKGSQVLGNGEQTSFILPVGTHAITLSVVDSGGNRATDSTTVTVQAFGYPDISGLTPTSSSLLGGDIITITGSGFTYSTNDTIVHFGDIVITGDAITILSATTLTVVSPVFPITVSIFVSVETPLGRSNELSFFYESAAPIQFNKFKLMDFTQVTSGKFGPDGKLYVGTYTGKLTKLTMNVDYTQVVSSVEKVVQSGRAILGIAFDPMDAGNPNPPIYISSSLLFHGESKSSSGNAINGKIVKISGANLDVITDVVTGLPVSDHDHAVNQLVFGNNGEVYINIGSNTNGGEPGRLSGSGKLKENFFSAATIVARLAQPNFNGVIQYNALDDGSPINSVGVEVFAPGLRNPFGITLHSNGNLYATDNGPNGGYGKMRVGCGPSDLIADQGREDKMVHLQQNKYYGHPNMKRATYFSDTRQCVWRNAAEPTSLFYESPISTQYSSATGIIEYTGDQFDGQLRHNLLHVKYKSSIRRTVLSEDGLSVHPLTNPAVVVVGSSGLDLAQSPNGNLFEFRYLQNTIWVNTPIEATTSVLKINTVYPVRGGQAGGTKLKLYGKNFGSNPIVTMGGNHCPLVSGTLTTSYMECTIPGGIPGLVDVVITSGTSSYTHVRGYRYITGF